MNKVTYHIVIGWAGYDVYIEDQYGGRTQIAYGAPHFDAAMRACVSHNGAPVTFQAVSV